MLLSLILTSFGGIRPTSAAEFTGARDTLSRLQASISANHTIVATLPTGVDFDFAGGTDKFVFVPTNFTGGGTWVTSDFTFNDGTARTIDAVAQGGGVNNVTCADGANNVGVAIDTGAPIKFRVMPCGASFTPSATAATVTFTIEGVAPNGTLTNPGGSVAVTVSMNDENVSAAHNKMIFLSIVDSDTVSTAATVDPTMTFDIDTNTSGADTGSPYAVALGSITTGAVATSGGSINSIYLDIATNATNGANITVINTDTDTNLTSLSVPGDAISSASGALSAGTEGYGICVVSATADFGINLATDIAPLMRGDGSNDGCTAGAGDHTVTVPPNSGSAAGSVLSQNGSPIVNGRIRIAVKAAISATTEAHADYTDSLQFIATANF